MKECKFCKYVGEEWTVTPKKKGLLLQCPICANVDCKTDSYYKRGDFETLDDLLDFINMDDVLPKHVISIIPWPLGFILIYYYQKVI